MITPSFYLKLFYCIGLIILLNACQGTGNTINFDPHALPSRKAQVIHEDLTILVEPFQDARPEQRRLGSRTHFWGGKTHFNAWNGNISEGMADLALEYLHRRNWQASKKGKDQLGENGSQDVTLTGTVLSLNANAKSGFGFTDIIVDMRVRFEARNKVDGSTVRMVLGANGSDTVGTFFSSDVDHLINVVAKDLYEQLFQDLVVKDKGFRLQADYVS